MTAEKDLKSFLVEAEGDLFAELLDGTFIVHCYWESGAPEDPQFVGPFSSFEEALSFAESDVKREQASRYYPDDFNRFGTYRCDVKVLFAPSNIGG